ncbi:hypothetical protein KUA55_15420 [Enterococcus sp. ALS3]|uniref:LPXTG cell wall anchor domain-containing protein n=1 Tax=Enterococcus alishanensis TaxID=1303817 RepID=A0ABS6TGJ0_9ENTE|nr:hypothetical protein [Enterococcus alishanensis]MBV7392071.1 hypothetical protein [Enterococcus alishanensis]
MDNQRCSVKLKREGKLKFIQRFILLLLVTVTTNILLTSPVHAEKATDQMESKTTIELVNGKPTDNNGSKPGGNLSGGGSTGSPSVGGSGLSGKLPQTNEIQSFIWSFCGTILLLFVIYEHHQLRKRGGVE